MDDVAEGREGRELSFLTPWWMKLLVWLLTESLVDRTAGKHAGTDYEIILIEGALSCMRDELQNPWHVQGPIETYYVILPLLQSVGIML